MKTSRQTSSSRLLPRMIARSRTRSQFMAAYSAACWCRPEASAEHSAITAEARAIGLV
ncbi:hypothetical protein D3C87_1812240 [compost metagenome]